MPAHPTPPPAVRLAVGVAVMQAAGLLAYGGSIVLSEQGEPTTGISGSGADLAPGVLVALYGVFAALVLLVARAYGRGARAAFTPFLLVQAFAVVVAQPLLSAASTRALGGLVLASAVAGGVAALSGPARRNLR